MEKVTATFDIVFNDSLEGAIETLWEKSKRLCTLLFSISVREIIFLTSLKSL